MADDVTVDNGAGTDYDVATDDDGSGNHVQLVKLVQGGDGSRTTIAADGNGLEVQGAVADGVAVAGNPVLVAGQDGTNTQSLNTNSSGHLNIADGGNSITVDQATASNLNALVKGADNHDQPALATTLGIGGYASAAAPADVSADGDAVRLWADRAGRLQVGDGGSTLSVDDGAGSLTVDNADITSIKTAVEVMDDWDESDRAKVNPIAGQAGVQGGSGTVTALTQRTVLATDVALPAGTNAIGKLAANDGVDIGNVDVASIAAGDNNIGNVDIVTMPAVTATDLDIRNLDVAQDDVRVGGMAAHDAAVADNPVAIGGRSNDAIPSEVSADGEAVWAWMLRCGAMVAASPPHLGLVDGPYTLLHETVQTTTTQTGTDILTVNSGKRLVVTYIQIQVGGTTAGTVQVWFGATADTTYTRGTDRAIFDGEFAPSATLKPGFVCAPPTPWIGAADEELHLTTSAAINPLTITVWFYEI